MECRCLCKGHVIEKRRKAVINHAQSRNIYLPIYKLMPNLPQVEMWLEQV